MFEFIIKLRGAATCAATFDEYCWSWVRVGARKALGSMGERALPILINALGGTDLKTRYELRETVMLFGKRAVPALIVALQHRDKFVRKLSRCRGKRSTSRQKS